MNVPVCLDIPVPCAVLELPVMGGGDSLALPPSALLLTLHGPSFTHIYILWETHLKGAFPNMSYVCGGTHAFNLWLFEARVSTVLLAELQSGPVMERFWLYVIKVEAHQ